MPAQLEIYDLLQYPFFIHSRYNIVLNKLQSIAPKYFWIFMLLIKGRVIHQDLCEIDIESP